MNLLYVLYGKKIDYINLVVFNSFGCYFALNHIRHLRKYKVLYKGLKYFYMNLLYVLYDEKIILYHSP